MNSKFISLLIMLAAVLFFVCPAMADGQITIVASGDGSYYFDEEIQISGTNTESDYVYLFITGPNLDPNGEKPGEFDRAAITGDEDTFIKTATNADDTWDYVLDPGKMDLSYGAYTIYAVTEPKNREDLSSGIYDTASIALKRNEPTTKAETNAGQTDTAETEDITIKALGDGSYYNGELITFSGTNTESDNVYLFITGPTLNTNGAKPDDPGTPAITGNGGTFSKTEVDANNKWKYELDTSLRSFDPGVYTVYAVDGPKNREDLSGSEYDTVSITIKRPFISAQVSEPVIISGEELIVTGTAEGMPHSVAIWVLGFDYWNGAETGSMVTVVPEDDGSYSYVLGGDETAKMEDGEYYVIVQHPMYNDEFDVVTKTNSEGISVSAGEDNDPGFFISGDYALRGADVAEALIEEIDAPDVDDTYVRCNFIVEGGSESNSGGSIFEAFGNFLAGIFG